MNGGVRDEWLRHAQCHQGPWAFCGLFGQREAEYSDSLGRGEFHRLIKKKKKKETTHRDTFWLFLIISTVKQRHAHTECKNLMHGRRTHPTSNCCRKCARDLHAFNCVSRYNRLASANNKVSFLEGRLQNILKPVKNCIPSKIVYNICWMGVSDRSNWYYP